MNSQLSIPIAFVAVVASFLSPCVLPLVPGYISMLSGESMEALKAGGGAPLVARIFRNSIAFVAGFSIVFIALGASATWVGNFLLSQRTVFNIVAGAAISIIGLHPAGPVRISFLLRAGRL